MDSSFCTSSPVEAGHSHGVAASIGKSSGLHHNVVRKYAVEMIFAVYRYFFKPALFALSGPFQQCRHPISCSEYTKHQFLTNPLHLALLNSARRIASCNPWTPYRPDRLQEKELS